MILRFSVSIKTENNNKRNKRENRDKSEEGSKQIQLQKGTKKEDTLQWVVEMQQRVHELSHTQART